LKEYLWPTNYLMQMLLHHSDTQYHMIMMHGLMCNCMASMMHHCQLMVSLA